MRIYDGAPLGNTRRRATAARALIVRAVGVYGRGATTIAVQPRHGRLLVFALP